jgi:hypothetical protein
VTGSDDSSSVVKIVTGIVKKWLFVDEASLDVFSWYVEPPGLSVDSCWFVISLFWYDVDDTPFSGTDGGFASDAAVASELLAVSSESDKSAVMLVEELGVGGSVIAEVGISSGVSKDIESELWSIWSCVDEGHESVTDWLNLLCGRDKEGSIGASVDSGLGAIVVVLDISLSVLSFDKLFSTEVESCTVLSCETSDTISDVTNDEMTELSMSSPLVGEDRKLDASVEEWIDK